MLSFRNGTKQYELPQSTSTGHVHNTELRTTYTLTADGNLPRGGREWRSTQIFPPKNTDFKLSKRILAKVFILLWIDFNIPLCEVIFSFVAIAMLQGRKREAHQLTFKTIVHGFIVHIKMNRKPRWMTPALKSTWEGTWKKKSFPKSSSHCSFSEWSLYPQCYLLIFFWTKQWTISRVLFFFFLNSK